MTWTKSAIRSVANCDSPLISASGTVPLNSQGRRVNRGEDCGMLCGTRDHAEGATIVSDLETVTEVVSYYEFHSMKFRALIESQLILSESCVFDIRTWLQCFDCCRIRI
jgi:hypothetical protein